MNLKMAAKVRFYLRVCLVDIDMNDEIFFFPLQICPLFRSSQKRWPGGEMRFCLVVSLALARARN